MATHLVDANVLLDIMTRDPKWFQWSSETLRELANYSHSICLTVTFKCFQK